MKANSIDGNKKAAIESDFDVIGRNCLDGRGTDREIIQYPTISVNIQLNTSTAQRDSVMSSCGVAWCVRSQRKTPIAYNRRTAGYDNPRRINSTVSARSH